MKLSDHKMNRYRLCLGEFLQARETCPILVLLLLATWFLFLLIKQNISISEILL